MVLVRDADQPRAAGDVEEAGPARFGLVVVPDVQLEATTARIGIRNVAKATDAPAPELEREGELLPDHRCMGGGRADRLRENLVQSVAYPVGLPDHPPQENSGRCG